MEARTWMGGRAAKPRGVVDGWWKIRSCRISEPIRCRSFRGSMSMRGTPGRATADWGAAPSPRQRALGKALSEPERDGVLGKNVCQRQRMSLAARERRVDLDAGLLFGNLEER